ncbi:MAG: DUF547 domain-containing protein [Planctomycetota bacterium]
MTRFFIFFTILNTVLLLITGCSAPVDRVAEPLKTQRLAEMPEQILPQLGAEEPIETETELPEIVPFIPDVNELPEIELPQIELITAGPAEELAEEKEPVRKKPPKEKESEPKSVNADSFHRKCEYILNTFVDEQGLVNYKKLKRKSDRLRKLLRKFAELDPKRYEAWPEKDKIAFWLNAYNLQTLRIIVDNYPIQAIRLLLVLWPPDDIRHIRGIWSKYKFLIMDEQFTLDELKQRFFRGQFDEPRLFFAVSYASLSSPLLRNEPYTAEKLDEQLDEQVKKFLSCSDNFRIDRSENKVFLSSIFQPSWFGTEFVSRYGTDKKFKDHRPESRAVLNFIINYIPQADADFLEVENYTIKYTKYNWLLNQQ